jgi:hypothetical protein
MSESFELKMRRLTQAIQPKIHLFLPVLLAINKNHKLGHYVAEKLLQNKE